jgi:hypothetical protein
MADESRMNEQELVEEIAKARSAWLEAEKSGDKEARERFIDRYMRAQYAYLIAPHDVINTVGVLK